MSGGRRLSPRAIALLDAVRGGAALYVVAHHLILALPVPALAALPFWFGQEAVIAFFLLSGFLIFTHEQGRTDGLGGYALRRLLRIYPVLLAAILISTLLHLQVLWRPRGFPWEGLWGTLLGLQDQADLKPGVIVAPYLHNAPLWSLSYEIAFYVLFPAMLVAWRRWPRATTHAIGAAACLAYLSYALSPNHWSLVLAYFELWWAGALAAQAYARGGRSIGAVGPALFWLAALTLVAAGVAAMTGFGGAGVYPALPVRHFAFALVLLAAAFTGLGRIAADLAVRAAGPAAWIASISYGLYAFHYPLLIRPRAEMTPLDLALAGVALIALAWLFDRRLGLLLRRLTRRHAPERQTGPEPARSATDASSASAAVVETESEKA